MATLAVSLLLAGCSLSKSDQPNNKHTEKPKDELVLAFGSEPETGFDPISGWGRYGSPLFQSTLLKRDDQLNIVNDLAEQVMTSVKMEKYGL